MTKTETDIPPNELSDLYEAFFTLLEHLPEETHPGWVFAIESILFGGEGLAEDATCYGEQQRDRNEFKITTYRELYGDGTHVTDFPTIETELVSPTDEPYLNSPVHLPVAPLSGIVLPLFVDNDDFGQAISLLNEFPAEPDATEPGNGQQQLLNPHRFPGLDTDSKASKQKSDSAGGPIDDHDDIGPNELAEIYDGLLSMLHSFPEDVHPVWKEAIETMLSGGEYLLPKRIPYGEQQAKRNKFGIADYRTKFGDGERVTKFETVAYSSTLDGDRYRVVLHAAESKRPLPHSPAQDELEEALLLLDEFPAVPAADDNHRSNDSLLFISALLKKAGIQPTVSESESTHSSSSPFDSTNKATDAIGANSQSDIDSIESAQFDRDYTSNFDEKADESEPKTLFKKGVGESSEPLTSSIPQNRDSLESKKYEDPRAQRAHERAKQRDPSEVVKLGEEIELVLQEVDYKYANPTIMGTKNKLVIFVDEAPQGLDRFDKIRAKVVDYGGNNTCAHAIFTGYVD